MGRFAEKPLHQMPSALAQVATASVPTDRLLQREYLPLTECSHRAVKWFKGGLVGQVSDIHDGASLELDARLSSECLSEFFGGYFCLPQHASKCADLDFRMHGNYAALAAASQNDVTAALTNPYKSESL